MEASEMLDVIHVLFEDDTLPRWEQDVEVKSRVRESLYRTMYGTEYKYGYESDQGRSSSWELGDASASAYDAPLDGSIKPYFPPSSQEEMFNVLGAPMGE